MANAFPELPREDCSFSSPLQAIEKPMLPKSKWAGATDYDDPNYPHGGGPDDVPVAPPLMAEAVQDMTSPPFQTPLGGGGGGAEIKFVQAVADGSGGRVSVKEIQHIVDLGATPNFEQVGDAFQLKYFKT